MIIKITDIKWDTSIDPMDEFIDHSVLPDHVEIDTDHPIDDIRKFLEEEYEYPVLNFKL